MSSTARATISPSSAVIAGGYYLLIQFTISFGKRMPDMPLYALFLLPLVAVFVLRMVAMSRRPRGALTPSTS